MRRLITDVGEDTENRELIDGKYLFRLEKRTLDDIRAFGVNSPEDEKRFAAVARVSEVNLGLYRTFVEPWVRATTTEPMAEAIREMHPHRLRFRVFSDRNPLMAARQGDGGGSAREPEAGQRGQSLPCAREGRVGVDHDLPSVGGRGSRRADGSDLPEYLRFAPLPGHSRAQRRADGSPTPYRARGPTRASGEPSFAQRSNIDSRPEVRTRARFAR